MLGLVTNGSNKGALRERVADMAKRCGDLTPIAPEVQAICWEANKRAVLTGKTYDGHPVAPLRPSTLKRRKGTGPPRAPNYAQSSVITMCEVNVIAGPGKLTFTKGYPGFEPILGWLDQGTKKMRARPTMGFGRDELEATATLVRKHMTGWRGMVARLFG